LCPIADGICALLTFTCVCVPGANERSPDAQNLRSSLIDSFSTVQIIIHTTVAPLFATSDTREKNNERRKAASHKPHNVFTVYFLSRVSKFAQKLCRQISFSE
jgi:hypothetical protein